MAWLWQWIPIHSTEGSTRTGAAQHLWQSVIRNVAAIGATPSQPLTDCLNFGNPEKPEAFWEFREAVKGLSEACKKLWLKGYVNQPIPIVSGNVSFYNECPSGSDRSIPGGRLRGHHEGRR